jgi:hypothetical protein
VGLSQKRYCGFNFAVSVASIIDLFQMEHPLRSAIGVGMLSA